MSGFCARATRRLGTGPAPLLRLPRIPESLLPHTDLIRAAGVHLLLGVQKIMIWVRSADRIYFLTERDHEHGQG